MMILVMIVCEVVVDFVAIVEMCDGAVVVGGAATVINVVRVSIGVIEVVVESGGVVVM